MSEKQFCLEARKLTRTYQVGNSTVVAVDDVDFQVARGEFVAVVGVSGSGKSTLLHLLGGLDTPEAGIVSYLGREISSAPPHERSNYLRSVVGVVFQTFFLLPRTSAIANVELSLTIRGVYGTRKVEKARRALELVGLSERAMHTPSQLSGGEQQRVAIARAIAHEPSVLLLDEPTGNLDHATGRRVMSNIEEIRDKLGCSVVMVTHDGSLADEFASRVVELRDGRAL